MTSFKKDQNGNLNIISDPVQPETVIISRVQAEKELNQASEYRNRLASELVFAEENVIQKQAIVDKCIELNVVE